MIQQLLLRHGRIQEFRGIAVPHKGGDEPDAFVHAEAVDFIEIRQSW